MLILLAQCSVTHRKVGLYVLFNMSKSLSLLSIDCALMLTMPCVFIQVGQVISTGWLGLAKKESLFVITLCVNPVGTSKPPRRPLSDPTIPHKRAQSHLSLPWHRHNHPDCTACLWTFYHPPGSVLLQLLS